MQDFFIMEDSGVEIAQEWADPVSTSKVGWRVFGREIRIYEQLTFAFMYTCHNFYSGNQINEIQVAGNDVFFLSFCFQHYERYGTLVYVAVSADASCRGLVSPRSGPLVMEFSQGQYYIVL